jgi:general stress protein CsbA
MALVFGAVALVLLYAPVHEEAFVGTVLALLVVSMGVETRLILRRMDQGTLRS